jgi:hypothetical protein
VAAGAAVEGVAAREEAQEAAEEQGDEGAQAGECLEAGEEWPAGAEEPQWVRVRVRAGNASARPAAP